MITHVSPVIVVETTADSALEFGLVQNGLSGREEDVKRAKDVGDGRVGSHTQAGRPKRAPRKWLSLLRANSTLLLAGGLVGVLTLGVVLPKLVTSPPSEWNTPMSLDTVWVVLYVAISSMVVTVITWLNEIREFNRGPSRAIRELVAYAVHEWDARSHQPMDRP